MGRAGGCGRPPSDAPDLKLVELVADVVVEERRRHSVPRWERVARNPPPETASRSRSPTPSLPNGIGDSPKANCEARGLSLAASHSRRGAVSQDLNLLGPQIAYDLPYAGVMIIYSWPSGGRLATYFGDEEFVQWSVGNFATFVRAVIGQTGASKLNLVAHSMGSRLLPNTLAKLASEAPQSRFAEVVFAAADVPAWESKEPSDSRSLRSSPRGQQLDERST